MSELSARIEGRSPLSSRYGAGFVSVLYMAAYQASADAASVRANEIGQTQADPTGSVHQRHQVPGAGILDLLDPGLTLTLKDTITLMMTLSDNTATNMVIDVVGLQPTKWRRAWA